MVYIIFLFFVLTPCFIISSDSGKELFAFPKDFDPNKRVPLRPDIYDKIQKECIQELKKRKKDNEQLKKIPSNFPLKTNVKKEPDKRYDSSNLTIILQCKRILFRSYHVQTEATLKEKMSLECDEKETTRLHGAILNMHVWIYHQCKNKLTIIPSTDFDSLSNASSSCSDDSWH